jgi:hypothetical protein
MIELSAGQLDNSSASQCQGKSLNEWVKYASTLPSPSQPSNGEWFVVAHHSHTKPSQIKPAHSIFLVGGLF